jgi:serine/threonine-protein kinase
VGAALGTFRILQPIGVGGMGAVFLAHDERLDRPVALKVLPPDPALDLEAVQRFEQEGRSAAQLDHENIARVYTIGADQGFHYIAFEYIAGTTIRRKVEQEGPLPIADAIHYTLQIASALIHAAQRGVVHRDIKPSNIIITPQGRAKLVDMGLARQFERAGDDGLTQTGMTLGTFDYISPEQARDPRQVDVRSDLYSLGCTLYHMLTGSPPFPGGTVLQKLLQHQEEPPPDVRLLRPDVPADLAAILQKLMAKDRDRRYQTPEQLRRELLAIAGPLGPRAIPPEDFPWVAAQAPPAWERHLIWAIPILAFAVVIASLFWFNPFDEVANRPAPAAGSQSTSRKTETEPAPEPPALVDVTPAIGPRIGPPELPNPPREIFVAADSSLDALIASVPSGTILTLTDRGPYALSGLERGRLGDLSDTRFDLTIRAAPGVRPILRCASAATPRDIRNALLEWSTGHLLMQDLDLIIQAESTGILVRNADLTLMRTRFQVADSVDSDRMRSALDLRNDDEPGRDGARIRITSSQIGPGLHAVRCRGPVELDMRDVAIGPGSAAVWCEDASARGRTPLEIRLLRVSMRGGRAPLFRFEGVAPRVYADRCVFSGPMDQKAVLIQGDDLAAIDWRGRGNLYSEIEPIARSISNTERSFVVRTFEEWAQAWALAREVGSRAMPGPIWAKEDPERWPDPTDPARLFALASLPGLSFTPGLVQGPFGPIPQPMPAPNQAGSLTRLDRALSPAPGRNDPAVPSAPPSTPRLATDPPAEGEPVARSVPKPPGPMAIVPMTGAERDAAETQAGRAGDAGARGAGALQGVAAGGQPVSITVSNRAEWTDALARIESTGGTILLDVNEELELPAWSYRGSGRCTIQAANPQVSLPRLRLRPPLEAPAARRKACLRVESGRLEFVGVHLILPRVQALRETSIALVRIDPGATLVCERSTLTLEGDSPESTLFALETGEELGGNRGPQDRAGSLLKLSDCLLRSGGDVVDIAGSRRIDGQFTNCVIASAGAFWRGHGLARAEELEPASLNLDRCLSRSYGGLVALQSGPGAPALPRIDLSVRDSILSTTREGEALFRIESQDDRAVPGNQIQWEGRSVFYHRIETYRRDQSAQPGSMPVRLDRPSWETVVADRDNDATHGDARFASDWTMERPIWTFTREDARLSPDSPAQGIGPDLKEIPSAPSITGP